jgi:hypothetical protein
MFCNKIQKKNVNYTEDYKFTNDFAAAINKICENLSVSSLTAIEGQIAKRTALACAWRRNASSSTSIILQKHNPFIHKTRKNSNLT